MSDLNADQSDCLVAPGHCNIGLIVGQIVEADTPEGREVRRILDEGLCTNCFERKGTIPWGDLLAMTHGGGTLRCGVCVYSAQLSHALNRTKAIPSLVYRLAKAYLSE